MRPQQRVADKSVLFVYVQYFNDSNLKQDILMSTNLNTTNTGLDIFTVIDTYFESNNRPYENLVALCTDVAKAIMAKNNGFYNYLTVKASRIYCFLLHGIIRYGIMHVLFFMH